jgi:hypothetical protein
MLFDYRNFFAGMGYLKPQIRFYFVKKIDPVQKPWIVPIPGTTKLYRLEENPGAINLNLTPKDLKDIDEAASKIPIQGARYPESMQRLINRSARYRISSSLSFFSRDEDFAWMI